MDLNKKIERKQKSDTTENPTTTSTVQLPFLFTVSLQVEPISFVQDPFRRLYTSDNIHHFSYPTFGGRRQSTIREIQCTKILGTSITHARTRVLAMIRGLSHSMVLKVRYDCLSNTVVIGT